MHSSRRLLLAVFVSLAIGFGVFSNAAFADTVKVWKWRDANGQVVYSQQPPPGNTKVEEKHIDPNHNVIESGWSPPAPAASASGSASSSTATPPADDAGSRIAREGGAVTGEPPVPTAPPIFPARGAGGM